MEYGESVVLESAKRHGVAEQDALHAWAFAIDAYEVDDGMPRSIHELIARADEIADQFERYDPRDEDRHEPALMALRRISHRRALVERELANAVRDARKAGASWAKIGSELGTSGEAARQRYSDRVA